MMHADDSEHFKSSNSKSRTRNNSSSKPTKQDQIQHDEQPHVGSMARGRNGTSEVPEQTSTATPAATTNNGNTSQGNGGGGGGQVSSFCSSIGLCCFKFKERSQITALDMKLTNRQKKFGVDYLDLVERKASQQALKSCLKTAMDDINEIKTEINLHHDAIEEKEGQEVHRSVGTTTTRTGERGGQQPNGANVTAGKNNTVRYNTNNDTPSPKKNSTHKKNSAAKKKKTSSDS
jgi:hypothetical protein